MWYFSKSIYPLNQLHKNTQAIKNERMMPNNCFRENQVTCSFLRFAHILKDTLPLTFTSTIPTKGASKLTPILFWGLVRKDLCSTQGVSTYLGFPPASHHAVAFPQVREVLVHSGLAQQYTYSWCLPLTGDAQILCRDPYSPPTASFIGHFRMVTCSPNILSSEPPQHL